MAAASAAVPAPAESGLMGDSPGLGSAGYVSVGGRSDLVRFLAEYDLAERDVRGLITAYTPPGARGAPGPEQYLVHASLLRSHGEFPCAGDAEALSFCRQIADELVALFGIAHEEAVARINRDWSQPGSDGRVPRIWIVGLDIAYHETPAYWAYNMYYGHGARRWTPGAEPMPVPPP